MAENCFVGAYGSYGCIAKRIGSESSLYSSLHNLRICPRLSIIVGMPFMLASTIVHTCLAPNFLISMIIVATSIVSVVLVSMVVAFAFGLKV